MPNRRSFLGSLAALIVAPFLPAAKPPALAFHPKSFAMAMAQLRFDEVNRRDVIYGFAMLKPNTAVQVSES